MRDIFEPIASDPAADPTESARRNMRALRRRFYAAAAVREVAGRVRGRPSTTGRSALRRAIPWYFRRGGSPRRPRPSGTPRANTSSLRKCRSRGSPTPSSTASPKRPRRSRPRSRSTSAPISCSIAPPARSAWSRVSTSSGTPCSHWARDALGARFLTGTGVMPLMQPEQALVAARAAIPHEPWRLGAVHAVTTLTGSALLALALCPRRHHQRGGVDRGERRRGLEHRAMGRRYARARAPRVALR